MPDLPGSTLNQRLGIAAWKEGGVLIICAKTVPNTLPREYNTQGGLPFAGIGGNGLHGALQGTPESRTAANKGSWRE